MALSNREIKQRYRDRCRENDPEGWKARVRAANLWKRYKLLPHEYDALIAMNEGRCDCCGADLAEKTAHIDHCHASGDLRGVLCGPCNKGIGLLGDTLEGAHRAAAYLSRGLSDA